MTTLVLAPDKFKGSLTAPEVVDALTAGIRLRRPDVTVVARPVADGGEGTLDAFLAAGFVAVPAMAAGPWDTRRHTTRIAVRGSTAVVEMAASIGGAPRRDNPLTATTLGVGHLVRHALDMGCTDIILALGGSVSTDGGAGMLQTLGAVLQTHRGRPLPLAYNAIANAASLDLTDLDPRLSRTAFTLAADVTNPLLGASGAAAVFSPQKGATPAQVVLLENRLRRWGELVNAATNTDMTSAPGAGSAGGTGFGAMAVLGARFRRGVDVVRDVVQLDDAVAGATLVVTGEGCLDTQSLHGKAPMGVAECARAQRVPVIAVAGTVRLDRRQARAAGFSATYALTDVEPNRAAAMSRAADLVTMIGDRIAERHLGPQPTLTSLRRVEAS
ncbi:glycerate kinase [Mycolicibacterium sp. 050158]|uniref:glycerate kinase n=1 Tax=Mycolicibacterium sp. 050158 TaxID=3090602 RepID=UPI00299D3FD3|nr:glycerate kinase [Mycolicibacterium sp. 050158]MDX1893054.1 glycerate kinase [Mycolicibacterium sp. 050158]